DPLAGGTSPANPSDGRLNVVWNDASGAGINFPADQPAFELCFTAENTTATPITFFNEATTLRAFNELGARLPASGNPGAVNSNCGGTPTCNDGIQNGNETGVDCGGSCAPCDNGGGPDLGCGMGTSNLSLCLGDYCNVGVGAQVCVEITAGNFTDVTAFQTDVLFNAGQLTFVNATTNNALQDPFQVSTPAAGTVRLLYFQNAQSGITVADGTIIGSLCFTNNTTDATILSFSDLVVTGNNGQVPNPVGNGGTINDDCDVADPCNNGVQDGDETGVDCGGSCAPCGNGGGPDLSCGDGTSNVSLCLGD
ncbi:MAG: cohesin domain-containing protein, partial [Bacteroidota bacterium]